MPSPELVDRTFTNVYAHIATPSCGTKQKSKLLSKNYSQQLTILPAIQSKRLYLLMPMDLMRVQPSNPGGI